MVKSDFAEWAPKKPLLQDYCRRLSSQSGRCIEIGAYDPLTEPDTLKVNSSAQYWMKSDTTDT